jgi:hypothetical protein
LLFQLSNSSRKNFFSESTPTDGRQVDKAILPGNTDLDD